MKLLMIIVASLAALAFPVGSQAATIALADNVKSATIMIDCPKGCRGYVGDLASLTTDKADAYRLKNASEKNLASAFNALVGASFAAGDVVKTDVGGDGESFAFSVGKGAFFAKYGRYTSFLMSDAMQTVTFTKSGRGPAGLSNFGTIGAIRSSAPIGSGHSNPTAPVPLPAAVWLLVSACAGLFALRRRRAA